MAPGLTERAILWALLLLGACAVWDGVGWVRATRVNQAIASGEAGALREHAAEQARFARAVALARDGEWQEALAIYQRLEREPDRALTIAARYNAGNLYLREAMTAAGDRAQSLPLVELAKRAYREVLREDPTHWDARYNLERSLRLAPELDEARAEAGPSPRQSERAVTTMRGFTLGLP